jgi:hypothetical protein
LVIAMAYGTRLGIATLAGYLLAGALGVPVFAGTPEKGIGVPYMLGPTAGYLLGFLLSTYVMGKLAQHGWDRSLALSLAAMTLGHIFDPRVRRRMARDRNRLDPRDRSRPCAVPGCHHFEDGSGRIDAPACVAMDREGTQIRIVWDLIRPCNHFPKTPSGIRGLDEITVVGCPAAGQR